MSTTSHDPYVVFGVNGKPAYRLNERLAKAQGITEQQLANLIDLHTRKLVMFAQMEALDPKTEVGKLKMLAAFFEQLEYQLQENWNFDQNKNFHEWYLVPHCKCPELDNRDRKGTPYRVTSDDCPIHGT